MRFGYGEFASLSVSGMEIYIVFSVLLFLWRHDFFYSVLPFLLSVGKCVYVCRYHVATATFTCILLNGAFLTASSS